MPYTMPPEILEMLEEMFGYHEGLLKTEDIEHECLSVSREGTLVVEELEIEDMGRLSLTDVINVVAQAQDH